MGSPPANANVPATPIANPIAVTDRLTASAAGIRARNNAVRERPVRTLSRNTLNEVDAADDRDLGTHSAGNLGAEMTVPIG